MTVTGIICEYNPFHNGHAYQIELAKQSSDAVVCVMSGSFVQRGEPALYDKYTRARAALSNGADLILELPVRYCLSSARGFALGAVETLNKTGVINRLLFGSECGDTNALKSAADILLHEPAEVSLKIKSMMSDGMGYAAARQAAYKGIIDETLLSEPNNILALEYISALKSTGSSVIPTTHLRTAGYGSKSANGDFASASFIREAFRRGEDIRKYVPYDYSECEVCSAQKLNDFFRYRMLIEGTDIFRDIPDAEIGMGERFLKAADCTQFEDTVSRVSTKRYTKSRIRRVMISALLNLRDGYVSPEYIRVLGMNKTGAAVLSEMKQKCSLPIVNKVADFDFPMLREDIRAANLTALCADRHIPQNRDYTTSPIIMF